MLIMITISIHYIKIFINIKYTKIENKINEYYYILILKSKPKIHRQAITGKHLFTV